MRKNFTAVALLCATFMVGMTACNKSNQGPEVPQAGESSYAVLSISLPTPNSTKAVDDVHQGDTYAGTVAENKVSSVLVGFYKDGKCSARIDLNATHNGAASGKFTGDDAADASTGSMLVTKAVKVPKIATDDSYDVVVFFNPTEEVKARINKDASIEDLKRFSNYDETKVITTNGIMMSNAKGLVTISGDKLYETKEKAEEAAAQKVSVQVERAVAKVFVNPAISAPASGSIAGAKLELQGWQLDVTNRKYFPMRVMDQAIKTNSVGSAKAELEKETATSARVNSYAKDPNFDAATTTIDTDNFKYLARETTLPTFYTAGYDDDKGHYVAENTMVADAQKLRGTTLVVFKVKVTPTIDGTAATSYVVYKGVAYTVDEFTNRVTKSGEGKTDAEISMPTGFGEAVKAFANTSTSTSGDVVLKEKIAAGKAFKENGISFYTDGVNYYHMPIRHFTNEQQAAPMQYGRYGLVRNNIYKLTINSVKNFGDPVPVEPGDENDDPETLFIAMSVELLPWLVRESGYDL